MVPPNGRIQVFLSSSVYRRTKSTIWIHSNLYKIVFSLPNITVRTKAECSFLQQKMYVNVKCVSKRNRSNEKEQIVTWTIRKGPNAVARLLLSSLQTTGACKKKQFNLDTHSGQKLHHCNSDAHIIYNYFISIENI